jgi:flagellar FliL protein
MADAAFAQVPGDTAGTTDRVRPDGRRRRLMMILGAGLLLILSMLGGLYVSGVLDDILGHAPEATDGVAEAEGASLPPSQYVDLPEMVTNLNASGRKTVFVRVRVGVAVPSGTDPRLLEAAMPRIVDSVQVYLRELRPEDLRGSGGMIRLREELLRRVRLETATMPIRDVVFKEVLVH